MTPKETYRDFCRQSKTLPIFHQDWWLDAVCGTSEWDVCISQNKAGKIHGVLPYYFQKRYGFKLLRQPILTPYLGIFYKYPKKLVKVSRKYSFEQRVTNELLGKLPSYAYFNQHFHSDVTNGQPFHWAGMQQNTYYSYALDLQQSTDEIWDAFDGDVRTQIKKAETQLQYYEDNDIESFYQINEKSFSHQNIKPPYDLTLLLELDSSLSARAYRSIHFVKDETNAVHAAIYLIEYKRQLYTLMIGSDPALRKSGAVSYLIWNIIQEKHDRFDQLDFCGSMIQRFQNVFSSYGAIQKPYFRIYHKASPLFKLISTISNKGL